jgi:phage tail tape-measure protein
MNWSALLAPGFGVGLTSDLWEAYIRADAYTIDKFSVVVTPDKKYATVKGYGTVSAPEQGIAGTRYAFKNKASYPQVFQYADPGTAAKEALKFKGVAGKLGATGIALDAGAGIYENIESGASTSKIVTDATVDVAIGAGSLAASAAAGAAIGAAVGTVVPGAGNIVGALAGMLVGAATYVATDVVQIKDKSASDWLKEGANSAVNAIGSWLGF